MEKEEYFSEIVHSKHPIFTDVLFVAPDPLPPVVVLGGAVVPAQLLGVLVDDVAAVVVVDGEEAAAVAAAADGVGEVGGAKLGDWNESCYAYELLFPTYVCV